MKPMKIIWCTCNVSSLDRLTELAVESGIGSFQIFPEMIGKTPIGSPRMDTPVWPGHNALLTAQAEEDSISKLVKLLAAYNSTVHNDDELVFCWSWDILQLI
jgi:hypothetical protein